MAEGHEGTAAGPAFTGRDDDDGTQVQACGHQHATRAEALACAEAQVNAIVAGALPACEPPGPDAPRQAVVAEFGMPVEWGDPWD